MRHRAVALVEVAYVNGLQYASVMFRLECGHFHNPPLIEVRNLPLEVFALSVRVAATGSLRACPECPDEVQVTNAYPVLPPPPPEAPGTIPKTTKRPL